MKDMSEFIGKKYGYFTVIDVVKARSGAAHFEFVLECVCGKKSYSRKYMLETGKHISCGCKGIASPIIGDKFGKWTVMQDVTKVGKRAYVCKCTCGFSKTLEISDLINGRSKGCQNCANNKTIKKRRSDYIPYSKVYASYKANAKKLNREFYLTFDEAQSLFIAPCHYCKVEPSTKVKQKVEDLWYNGIDRKDNSIGYTKENSVTCCKICNYAKHTMSYDEYKEWLSETAERLVAQAPEVMI